MPETTTEKMQEDTRRYMREAEDAAKDAFRMGNDLMTITNKYYLDAFDRMMHDGMELTAKTQHAMEDIMTSYRRVYTEGFKAWQDYLGEVNKSIVRPTK